MKADLAPRIIRRVWQKALYLEQWRLLYAFGDELPASFAGFRPLTPPRDRFWADPHIVRADGRYYIFVEEYLFRSEKGHIAVLEMDEQGDCAEAVKVLERPWHLSYPFVFAWEGGYFMAPESSANRTIALYECVEFPHRWRFRMNLMEGVDAVDSTLLPHDGLWWLFTGIAGRGVSLPYAQLHLFSAGSPVTHAWRAHPLNPLVADSRKGRPAGGVWRDGSELLRPSQDCTKTYGYGFDLNRILRLSLTDYAEETALSVRPDWDASVAATHTFSRAGRLTVIDAFVREPKAAHTWNS